MVSVKGISVIFAGLPKNVVIPISMKNITAAMNIIEPPTLVIKPASCQPGSFG